MTRTIQNTLVRKDNFQKHNFQKSPQRTNILRNYNKRIILQTYICFIQY